MANSANAISSRKRINTMRKVLIGFFSFALVLFGLTAPSQAADTLTGTTGHETSIAYTSGKAQGSNEWGLMGNVVVEKLEGKNAYPYGVEINPITGDMWVTDSGKVCWGRFQCLLGGAGLVDSAQTGTPSVRIYNLKDAADQQSGYAVDGNYSNFATHTTQSGLGQNWVPKQIIRTGVFDTDPKRHGPRGIEIAADGTVWIVDSEFTQTAAEAAADGSNKIKRFASDGTQLAGAGYSGVWADRSPGSFRNSWSVSVTEMLNGDFLAPASTAAQLNRFAADGTAKAPILLTNLAVPAAAQDYLGTVTRIEPHGVDVDPITGNIYVVPDFAFFNANQTDANKRVGGVFVLNPEGTEILNYVNERLFPYGIPTSGSTMFGPFVNNEQNSANYGSVFAWGQVQGNTNFIELSNTGDLLHTWQSGSTAAENAQDGTDAYTPRPQIISFPGLKNPRGIAYDANGYMYMTGADSETSPAGVRIIGMTPRPVQNLKAVQKCVPAGAPTADVELTWVHDKTASQSIAPTEDYVVEMTTDGGATWALVPTAKSTAKTETIPASVVAPYADEMAAGQVGFRVSAWNAAGNGDWIAATLLNDPCFKVEKTGVLAADGNTINWTITVTNTGTAALKNIQLVDHISNDEGGELAPVFLENPTIASLEPGTPHVLQVTTDVTDEQRVAGIAYNKVDATYTDIAGNDTVKTATASVNIPNKFTVTYVDGVDGEEVFANQATSEIIYGTATPAFNGEPTRPGYTFAGWSPAVAPTVTKDVTYVAQWTPIYYTVTYVDGVDGEEVFADQVKSDLAYGTATPGFTGTPERVGYKFLGWSPVVANTVTENITYTAQWDQEFYTVTYVDGVDGEEVFADQVKSDLAYGTATPGFTGEPTREGYDFTGWAPSVADTVTASVTYTAQWTPKLYTVTYVDGVDGEEVFADQVYPGVMHGNAAPTFLGEPKRAGYNFIGWDVDISTPITANTTFAAIWELIPLVEVVPTEPKSVIPLNADDPASCKIAPYATVASIEGVSYEVKTAEGQILTPDADGVYHYAYGQTIVITAKANDGYVIAAGAQTEWTYTAPPVESCEDPVKPTDPVVDPDKPVDPSKPVDPTQPTQPAQPVNPTTPSVPGNSGGSDSDNPGVPPAPALDPVPTDETSGGSASKLAKTGAESVAGLIAGAIVLVGFGGLVLTRRRGE